MRRITQNFIAFTVAVSLVLTGCTVKPSPSPEVSADETSTAEERDNTPVVLVPQASGSVTYQSDAAGIDASNTSEGYIMVQYSGTNAKVKLQIVSPTDVKYTYLLNADGEYDAFPLTGGSGMYQITVYENISGDNYAAILSQSIEVTIADEFKPYLYPNQYVDFTPESKTVAKSAELAAGASSDLDVVTNIYSYVIGNISYDTELADNITYGYLPDVDKTLASGTGICFDYAAIMTAMLRSQRIPTKLEVGYADDLYHAWISTYVDEIGWVDSIIEFDGKSWSLMDPTLAASNNEESVKKYVGNGNHYTVKYTY